MGWSSGSRLFNRVIDASKRAIPDEKVRKQLYADLIEAFGDHDWDTENECLGRDSVYDELYYEMYPPDD